MPSPFCSRCGALTDAMRLEKGLPLCPRCHLCDPCAEWEHDYVGSAIPGTWSCRKCGGTLHSQTIALGPTEEP
jgi:ribosomal protein L37AE/L43A